MIRTCINFMRKPRHNIPPAIAVGIFMQAAMFREVVNGPLVLLTLTRTRVEMLVGSFMSLTSVNGVSCFEAYIILEIKISNK